MHRVHQSELRDQRRGPVWQPPQEGVLPPLSGRYITTRSIDADCRIRSKVLGTGASGQVRLAECRKTRRRFAVKSFRKGTLSAQQWRDLQGEVRVYLALDHPHIARLERVYDRGDDLHLVMEHLEGGEVFDWVVRCGAFSERAAADVARQALLAVAYLHAHNVVHRDLKLENLVYDRPEAKQVKLIDFGYAATCKEGSRLSHRCGSLQYVAPEVLARAYTEKVDIWSMGVLLYILLTGHPLHYGPDSTIAMKIQGGKLEFVPCFSALSKDARDLVQSLLTFDPKDRPSAVAALEHPWLRGHACPAPAADPAAVGRLRAFAGVPPLRRACLLLMASVLPSRDRSALQKQFQALDSEHRGVLTLGGLKGALGPSCDDAEAEAVFASLDASGIGEISWNEFLAAAMSEQSRRSKDVSRAAFFLFDDYQPGGGSAGDAALYAAGGALVEGQNDGADPEKEEKEDGGALFGSHAEFHSYVLQSDPESYEGERSLPRRLLSDMAGFSPVASVRERLGAEGCLPLRASIDLLLSQWWASFKLARMVSV